MTHNPEFLKLVGAARARVKECSVTEAKTKLDRGEVAHFIDVRGPRICERSCERGEARGQRGH